jgi:membrane peptidoglycan carboxypeptidase
MPVSWRTSTHVGCGGTAHRPGEVRRGTTQQHKSAAFLGVVPQMAGAVITFDDSNPPPVV